MRSLHTDHLADVVSMKFQENSITCLRQFQGSFKEISSTCLRQFGCSFDVVWTMKRGSFEYKLLKTCMWRYFDIWNFLITILKLPHKLPQNTWKFQGNFLETSPRTSTEHEEVSRNFPRNFLTHFHKTHGHVKKIPLKLHRDDRQVLRATNNLLICLPKPGERNTESYRAMALLALPFYHF